MNNIELINASAGSGKTFSLTARVVDVFINGVAPEALMATTFTNKAAAELLERIRVQLLKNNQPNEANRINDGFIGTVNSICARLLKEYALEAGMSPAIEIMPEEDSNNIFKISIDSVINQFAARMEPSARRMELNGSGGAYMSDTDWRDHVKKLVDLARSNHITPDRLKKCSQSSLKTLQTVLGEPKTVDLDKELKNALTSAIVSLSQIVDLTLTTQKALETLKDCEKRAVDNKLTWSDWIRLAKLTGAKDGKDAIAQVNSIADNVLCHPILQSDIRQMIEGTFSCAIQALEDYEIYKQKHGLMDFTDQETRVLDMAQHNDPFRSSMSDRIQLLMVDEFQDTSPIQLALFLAMHELAGKSVWVGDPKQAIYGFRGTDPQLMDEVVSLIGESEILDSSWRSREKLLDFTNALFAEVFYYMGKEKVCLKVPAERTQKAVGGQVEAWHLIVKNNAEEAAAVANGVRDFIERNADIKPGDIAVLCKTNATCLSIAAALEHLGVRVSVGQGSLLDAQECKLALAALRYMNNQSDVLALTEIIRMHPKCESGKDWLSELMTDPDATKNKWCDAPLLADLVEGGKHIKYWTPIEALEQAISRIGLLRSVKSRPRSKLARSNLDALRGTCQEYVDRCAAHRSAATVDGFMTYLRDAVIRQAQGRGEQTVNLLTYHGSKGLEWPWVVLTGLDALPRADVFGVHIEAATKFDPKDPLANRTIRYWPWPFGAQRKHPILDGKIDALPLKQIVQDKAEREAQRLLYVGMTRARDGLIMAMRKTANSTGVSLKTGWLDALRNASGEQVINWSTEAGSQSIKVGTAQIPITVLEYGSESAGLPGLTAEEDEYLPSLPDAKKEYPAARVAPSSLTKAVAYTDGIAWETIERFNARIDIMGKPEMDALGSAIHAYLAIEYWCLPDCEREELAKKILNNWGVETAVNPSELVTAGQRLVSFMDQRYTQYTTFKEWPMTLRNDKGQLIQGWIDLLLETPNGYIIIDHKCYPGQDSEERVKKYGPQLSAYKEAVEKATGRPVIDILLHLPVSGLILRLK